MEGNTQQLIDYLTLIFGFHIDSGVLILMGTERELYLERKQMNHNLRWWTTALLDVCLQFSYMFLAWLRYISWVYYNANDSAFHIVFTEHIRKLFKKTENTIKSNMCLEPHLKKKRYK